jgi:probable rRNA maturation factor
MAAGGDIQVEIIDRQRAVHTGSAWLTRIVRRALARLGVDRAEISILLVGDRRMARLHEEWLGVPGPTDVITFDLAGPEGESAEGLRGDIVVSAETARRMARELGWAPRHELAYYVIHGLLHLAGHDDVDPVRRRAMRARERVLMAAAGLPLPPRGRTRRTTA